MKKSMTLFVLTLALSIPATPLLAHHGSAAFDTSRTLTLKGTVTQWLWANPHCLLEFNVTGKNGKVVHWIAETQNPVTMTDGGWSKFSFKPGDKVTVTLEPVKNGNPAGRIMTVVLPNGNTLNAMAGIRGLHSRKK